MRYRQQWRGTAGMSASEQAMRESLQPAAMQALQQLRESYHDKTLPILHLPQKRDDLNDIQRIADAIRRDSTGLVVLGAGGSSLGGQTLCALSESDFPVWFFDNLDPHTLTRFLGRADLGQLHFLIISKSGSTVETLTQCLLLLQALESRMDKAQIAKRCHAITIEGESPLRELAARYNIPTLAHDANVGGRYSVLSLVGLIPAAVVGVDIEALRRGAAGVMEDFLKDAQPASLLGALWQVALMKTRPTTVFMPYCDRLSLLGAWYVQLWAESIGKGGQGSTPVRATGATDQHSQLQLYLDGPKDKSFTFITLPHGGKGAKIDTHGIAGLEYLQGKSVGDVMASLQHGTIETITAHELPMRVIELDGLDAETLGALLMHFMLETALAAQMMAVDAFDQPAVEHGKSLARDYLRQGNAA